MALTAKDITNLSTIPRLVHVMRFSFAFPCSDISLPRTFLSPFSTFLSLRADGSSTTFTPLENFEPGLTFTERYRVDVKFVSSDDSFPGKITFKINTGRIRNALKSLS